jgi:transcription antitermination factor NusG
MVATRERKSAQDEVFQCLRPISELTGHWWLCMTHGGQEKRLARRLAAARVDYFLPLSEKRDNSRHITTRPLFANYLFVNGDESREVCSRAAEKVCIYPVALKSQRPLQHELEQVYRALQSNPALGTETVKITRGTRCRVLHGPMMGIEGVYDSDAPEFRVYLVVSYMNRAVQLAVPREFCEPI